MWYIPNAHNVGQLEKIAYTSPNLSKAGKQTRHTTIYPTMGLIAALTISPVSGLSCRTLTRVKEPTPIVSQRDYNKDLEAALGARWYSLNNEQKDTFRNGWGAAEDDVQRYMVEIYSNPKKIYMKFSEDEQKCFRKFVSELDQKTVNKYKEALPWMNPKQLTLADQLFIYWIERIGYRANLR